MYLVIYFYALDYQILGGMYPLDPPPGSGSSHTVPRAQKPGTRYLE